MPGKAKQKPNRAEPSDWRAETLARMRELILAADPEIIEERKWKKPSNPAGVPVWSRHGILCTGETYKNAVKLTFAHGASLPDPKRLFNAGLDGNMRRAIDIHEGQKVDVSAFKALVKAAVKRNAPAKAAPKRAAKVVLLSGGNPQIAKGDGDAPIQAYIAAMPGWKHELGKRLDALIVKTVPKATKAVKWNSPFYGVEGQGWFLALHVFTHFVRVTWFRGTSLKPLPPGPSKSKEVRYYDIRENAFDEAQMASWVKQAAKLPGWMT